MRTHRERIRPKWSDEDLQRIYAEPHDSDTAGTDHWVRASVTTAIAGWMLRVERENRRYYKPLVADLSCGNGNIAFDLRNALVQPEQILLGDYAPGYQYVGPIEKTIDEIPEVDLFICSETIEHLDDPDLVLRKIREKSEMLVLSTPIWDGGDPNFDLGNEQHYWRWTQDGVKAMLDNAGWEPAVLNELWLESYYSFQIWGCK